MCQRLYIVKAITLKIKVETATSKMKVFFIFCVHVPCTYMNKNCTEKVINLIKGVGKGDNQSPVFFIPSGKQRLGKHNTLTFKIFQTLGVLFIFLLKHFSYK